jgi:hypothetical protein
MWRPQTFLSTRFAIINLHGGARPSVGDSGVDIQALRGWMFTVVNVGFFPMQKKMAERGGFEPPVRFYPYNSLANCRFRPLSHLSNRARQ